MIGVFDGSASYPRYLSLLERDIREMAGAFPKLSHGEVRMTIEAYGPDRERVERELKRLSDAKSGT
jgi:hypothetical protein